MSDIKTNREREIAKNFVLHTRKNVFLTGKAGTGKTTLLKEILKETDKNYIVTAPTGVAAINAGGVTLHSLLSLPLKTYIPYRDRGHDPEQFYDARELAKHQKFNTDKIKLLLELDLLIIDEISMVRADIFDAIDQTLRRVRKNSQAFGGVQLLVIGDLFQLSPVVRNNIQDILSIYYKSPYFFDSLVWTGSEAVIVELKTVYRQEEQEFIDILNSIRSGKADQKSIDRINQNYSDTADYSNTITLTTHNKKAGKINSSELEKLESESNFLTAEVTGRFYENSYPNDEVIELKVGAQVMFIRNHAEELYFNGKIGKITEIKENYIKVKGDDGITIIVEPVEWKNVVYELDKVSGNIVQNEVGTYVQYPLRLAWAVTVHKSQGLTFDKVILDLEGTFASGQLYVALSRCRSLSGLVLTSKISEKNVIIDSRVQTFTQENQLAENIEEILEIEKSKYNNYKLQQEFSLTSLLAIVDPLEDMVKESDMSEKPNRVVFFKELKLSLQKLIGISTTFQSQLANFFEDEAIDVSHVLKRCVDGIDYFTEQLHTELVIPTIKHAANYAVKKDEKKYTKALDELEDLFWSKIESLYSIVFNEKKVYIGDRKYVNKVSSADRKSKAKAKSKKVKGETYTITYDMHKEGKSLAIIAKERGLALSTIESHFTKFLKEQRVSIFDIMKPDKVEKALKVAQANPDADLTELMGKMPFKSSYSELRWVTVYRDLLQSGDSQ